VDICGFKIVAFVQKELFL